MTDTDRLATMGEKLAVDLWHYESHDGRSIRKALDFLAEYVDPDKKWPYQQIVPSAPAVFSPFCVAALSPTATAGTKPSSRKSRPKK